MSLISIAQAQAAQTTAQQSGILMQVLPVAAIIFVVYFLIFRPQQVRQKKLRKLVSLLQYGDEVFTTGGLVGKVCAITEQQLTLEFPKGGTVNVLRSSIAGMAGDLQKKPKGVDAMQHN